MNIKTADITPEDFVCFVLFKTAGASPRPTYNTKIRQSIKKIRVKTHMLKLVARIFTEVIIGFKYRL